MDITISGSKYFDELTVSTDETELEVNRKDFAQVNVTAVRDRIYVGGNLSSSSDGNGNVTLFIGGQS